MKIAPRDAASFFQGPPPHICGALIYGPDSGQVKERADQLAATIVEDVSDPFAITDLSADAIKEDSALIADELSAISFGGGRKLVRILHAENALNKAIASALDTLGESLTSESFLLVTSAELTPSNGLRTLFEKHESLAAIACYTEDARGVANHAAEKLRQQGIQADHDVIPYLAAHCQGDRNLVTIAVEKLVLFAGEDKHITLEMAQEAIGDATEATLDDLCEAIFAGNQGKLHESYTKAISQGIEPIRIIRSINRHLNRTHTALGYIAEGATPDDAMKKLRPPVFFKQAPSFRNTLMRMQRHNPARVWQMFNTLYQAEHTIKTNIANPELVCNRLLMRAASLA